VNAPVAAPVTVCGNGGSVLGSASAGCSIGTAPNSGTGGTTSNGSDVPVNVPVTVCGNGGSVLGTGSSSCASVSNPPVSPQGPGQNAPGGNLPIENPPAGSNTGTSAPLPAGLLDALSEDPNALSGTPAQRLASTGSGSELAVRLGLGSLLIGLLLAGAGSGFLRNRV
jgi:hypothetical protein